MVEILSQNQRIKKLHLINGNNNAKDKEIGNSTQSHCPLMKLLKLSKKIDNNGNQSTLFSQLL
jgi:hypothetical protein